MQGAFFLLEQTMFLLQQTQGAMFLLEEAKEAMFLLD
jgi:hypothetical protein